MVDEIIDNKSPIDNDKALDLIKNYFKTELPEFQLIESFNKGNYFGFGLKYKSKTMEVNFASPRGGLEYEIFVEGNQHSLLSYEPKLRQVYICSDKNLRFLLSVVKQFYNEKSN